MKNESPKTTLDLFRIQEANINAEAREAEKHYNQVISEQEKIRDMAKARREKIQAALASMVSDFEKIEAGLEAQEAQRLDSVGLAKQALDDGQTTVADYFKQEPTAGEVAAKVFAGEKLADLRSVIRAKGREVLEAEMAELEAEYNLAYARQAPARQMRERLVAMLVALESSLSSPIGISATPYLDGQRDAKRRDLQNAQGKRCDGDAWWGLDLAGLKRLRLDPRWPEDKLPDLEKIIAEARAEGNGCRLNRLMLNFMRGKTSVDVMR